MGAGTGSGHTARGTGRGPATSPSTWYGLAVVGALVFAVGIWVPAWHGVADGAVLAYVFDIAGGVLFVVGATYGVRARQAQRPRPIDSLPGVEVFHPPVGPDRAPNGRPDEGGPVTPEESP